MVKFLSVFLLLTVSASLSAQQDATYVQYMFNMLTINPGYTGTSDALSASILERFQNVGLKGAPRTKTFSIHSPIVNRRVGLGLLVINDKIGIFSQTGINFSYAYRIPLNNKSVLSLGIQGGAIWYKADYADLALLQNPDPVFSQNIMQIRPNFGAGAYYYSERGYLGLSMPHMINNAFNTSGTLVRQNIPIILHGGYVFTLNRMIKLKPNFLFEILDRRPAELDMNVNALFDEVLWVGISYKTSQSAVLLTQIQINDQFRFGYSYQVNTGPIHTVVFGSHEIMANYRFKYNKKGVVTPRFF